MLEHHVRGWVASSCPGFCPLLPNKLLTGPGKLLLEQGEAPHEKDIWKRNPPAFPLPQLGTKLPSERRK